MHSLKFLGKWDFILLHCW